jgi:2,4-dienoyl-CoA reductase-like NADH-dependent reductase (Old Yellow Enzyme family)
MRNLHRGGLHFGSTRRSLRMPSLATNGGRRRPSRRGGRKRVAGQVDLSELFTPCRIGGLDLPNRIVLPSMGRFVHSDGAPTADVIDYYAARAAGGAGLILTEGVYVDHVASGDNLMMGRFYGRSAPAWGQVAQAVHAAGGLAIPQLWHVGLKYSTIDMTTGEESYRPELGLVGPSGYIAPDKQVAEPMTQAQIDDVVASFARGAELAKSLGYDGVEIHGAHGYLIDQFLWRALNHRTDGYGGGARNRGRFAAEIVAECRRRVGPDFPILMRISNWKLVDYQAQLAPTPQELGELLAPIAEAGVDLFDCSERRFWLPAFEGDDRNLAGWIKQLTGKPTMTCGSIGLDIDMWQSMAERRESSNSMSSFERLMAMFHRGDFDLVAVGRGMIADPDWATRVRDGEFHRLKAFTPDLIDMRRAQDDAPTAAALHEDA